MFWYLPCTKPCRSVFRMNIAPKDRILITHVFTNLTLSIITGDLSVTNSVTKFTTHLGFKILHYTIASNINPEIMLMILIHLHFCLRVQYIETLISAAKSYRVHTCLYQTFSRGYENAQNLHIANQQTNLYIGDPYLYHKKIQSRLLIF